MPGNLRLKIDVVSLTSLSRTTTLPNQDTFDYPSLPRLSIRLLLHQYKLVFRCGNSSITCCEWEVAAHELTLSLSVKVILVATTASVVELGALASHKVIVPFYGKALARSFVLWEATDREWREGEGRGGLCDRWWLGDGWRHSRAWKWNTARLCRCIGRQGN